MKILAVDDDPIVLDLLKILISTMGNHQIDLATSGSETLRILASGARYDCLLLDIQMPGCDGIALCKLIREMPAHRRMPILMITAMTEKRFIERAFQVGATDYIIKPFDIMDVRARLLVTEQRIAQLNDIPVRIGRPANTDKIEVNCPIALIEIENSVEPVAFENYLGQLSRSQLSDSGIFGLSIRGIAQLNARCSAYEFEGLIGDVAEAISDCLQPQQFLFTYTGNGTYDVVVEGGYRPDLTQLAAEINLYIQSMGLHLSTGDPVDCLVCAGDFVRLIWRNSVSLSDALIQAHSSAESRAAQLEHRQDELWQSGQAAR